jgi:hypothetical protein
MITELKKRFYNVCGVFFENSIAKNKPENEEIALLDWNERVFIQNPIFEREEQWKKQIQQGAIELCYHLLEKK